MQLWIRQLASLYNVLGFRRVIARYDVYSMLHETGPTGVYKCHWHSPVATTLSYGSHKLTMDNLSRNPCYNVPVTMLTILNNILIMPTQMRLLIKHMNLVLSSELRLTMITVISSSSSFLSSLHFSLTVFSITSLHILSFAVVFYSPPILSRSLLYSSHSVTFWLPRLATA